MTKKITSSYSRQNLLKLLQECWTKWLWVKIHNLSESAIKLSSLFKFSFNLFFHYCVCVCVRWQQICRIHSVIFCYWRVLQYSMKLIHTIHTNIRQEVDHSYSLTQDTEGIINSLKSKIHSGTIKSLWTF